MTKAVRKSESKIIATVPGNIDESQILLLLHSSDINWKYVDAMKTYTEFNDEVLSNWLNISVKTFRLYKKAGSFLKENVKEQVLFLLSLFKHGVEVFGTIEEFNDWLNRKNVYFGNKAPADFINTLTGIRFVDDRLTALEYGDNV